MTGITLMKTHIASLSSISSHISRTGASSLAANRDCGQNQTWKTNSKQTNGGEASQINKLFSVGGC